MNFAHLFGQFMRYINERERSSKKISVYRLLLLLLLLFLLLFLQMLRVNLHEELKLESSIRFWIIFTKVRFHLNCICDFPIHFGERNFRFCHGYQRIDNFWLSVPQVFDDQGSKLPLKIFSMRLIWISLFYPTRISTSLD